MGYIAPVTHYPYIDYHMRMLPIKTNYIRLDPIRKLYNERQPLYEMPASATEKAASKKDWMKKGRVIDLYI